MFFEELLLFQQLLLLLFLLQLSLRFLLGHQFFLLLFFLNSLSLDLDRLLIIIDVAVDFIRTYADRTHHGKEEEILFRYLAKKEMTPELQKIMQELLDEHVWGRKTTAGLVAAKEAYLSGDKSKLAEIIDLARQLANFYPQHIEKEDKHFFYPAQEYFTQVEQEKMLMEFWEFDRKMIHEKYNRVFEEYNRLTL
ncbi:MAG: cation-binding protein [Syntrophaceae bacterium]|nr:cation-binding protein [Syntrophaceae bacterium]